MAKRAMKFNRPHRCSVCGKTGHRKDGCPEHVPQPPKRPSPLDRATAYTTAALPKKASLKELQQDSYPTILKLTEEQARLKLKALGLLPPMTFRKCWRCGRRMAHCGRGTHALRCTGGRSCRTEVRRADVAYTPLWHMNKGGASSYKAYLNALYVYSLKIGVDSSRHLLGCCYDSAAKWSKMLRVGTAHAELHHGRDMEFPDGTVEVDATKTTVKRSKKKTSTHCGRFLVIYHRETGQYALEPLQDKDVLKGAPPAPEAYEEVKGPMTRKIHEGHVLSSDSGRAFKKVAREHLEGKGVAYATVVHKSKQFARVAHIPVKSLSKRVRDRVAPLPTTTKRTYRFKAGDQKAEGVFQAVKRNLKRMSLGRAPQNASLNFLASSWLSRCPGLEAVAGGFAADQRAIVDKCHPADAFKKTPWLRALEPMD